MAESRFPVSVKGVVLVGERAVLLRNDREEWELPGGRLEKDEAPEACVAREIKEELNLRVEVGPLLDAWVFEPVTGAPVLILTYGCVAEDLVGMEHSAEHGAVRLFREVELDELEVPSGYARSVRAWMGRGTLFDADDDRGTRPV